MMFIDGYDHVVGLIYDAALEPLRLKHAISAISECVSAAGVHLHALDKKSGDVVLSSLCGFSPLGEIDYMERYAKLDPRVPIAVEKSEGCWFSCHDHIPQEFVDSSEFYQDFLIPYGSRYLTATRLVEVEDYAVMLGVHRGPKQTPLDKQSVRLLQRLTPHLQRAMRIIYANARLRDQWAVVKATLDSFDYAALVCDENRGLLVGNEAACALLDQNDGIGLRNGRINIGDPFARDALRSAMTETPTGSSVETRGEIRAAVCIPRPSRLASYQLILREIRPERTIFKANGKMWSVTISDPAREKVPTIRALSMLYGLTPAETRLATRLVEGATPDEIAADIGVKITTVRSQLGSLFGKTGTRRQSELVGLFSSLPAIR